MTVLNKTSNSNIEICIIRHNFYNNDTKITSFYDISMISVGTVLLNT